MKIAVRISDVWDQTVDVLRGRAEILAGLATLTLILPGVLGAVIAGVAPPLTSLVRLATLILLIFGMLAVTAVASDPAVDRPQALRIAARRLLPALGALLVLVLAAALLFVPAGMLLALSGATMTAAGAIDVSQAARGYTAGAGLAVLLAAVLGLWFSARIVPLFGVVVNERRGFGALRRSMVLTRGATLRLIGVLILYFVVTSVTMLAATSVVGVVARLALGGDAVASVKFVVAVVTTLISAGATVLQSVFYARFYVTAVTHDQPTASLT
ncbi:hypothetical protein ASE95_05335 [Sphingomonas sp. Leaf231]|uniref:hypothetical protein n=1 Tax=Sphingomonas sp. Leaf231 TaxID=1736301 RepID=UPI000700F474|nr:hypothetical protein [Sphingomonas sp. Leaf231]KQN94266.1 hypothetical protein ASE95_05335 [Sphingomonas sp. Leaf231]